MRRAESSSSRRGVLPDPQPASPGTNSGQVRIKHRLALMDETSTPVGFRDECHGDVISDQPIVGNAEFETLVAFADCAACGGHEDEPDQPGGVLHPATNPDRTAPLPRISVDECGRPRRTSMLMACMVDRILDAGSGVVIRSSARTNIVARLGRMACSVRRLLRSGSGIAPLFASFLTLEGQCGDPRADGPPRC